MKATRTVSESGGPPARHIDVFLDGLHAAHYSEVTLRKKLRVLCRFSVCDPSATPFRVR